MLDFGLWLLTRASARNDFADRRLHIAGTLLKYFDIDCQYRMPRFGHSILCLYSAFRLTPKFRSPVQNDASGRLLFNKD